MLVDASIRDRIGRCTWAQEVDTMYDSETMIAEMIIIAMTVCSRPDASSGAFSNDIQPARR